MKKKTVSAIRNLYIYICIINTRLFMYIFSCVDQMLIRKFVFIYQPHVYNIAVLTVSDTLKF